MLENGAEQNQRNKFLISTLGAETAKHHAPAALLLAKQLSVLSRPGPVRMLRRRDILFAFTGNGTASPRFGTRFLVTMPTTLYQRHDDDDDDHQQHLQECSCNPCGKERLLFCSLLQYLLERSFYLLLFF